MADYNFKNNLKATLQSKLWSDATTIYCNHLVESEDEATRLAAWPSFPFTLTVVDTTTDALEVVLCTGVVSNSNNVIVFDCERAQEDTVAQTFEIATTSLEHRLTANALNTIFTSIDHVTTKSGVSATASGNAEKDVVCSGFELSINARVVITFDNANTVADGITLNVNNTGAKSVYNQIGIVSTTNTALLPANQPIEFRYDGTGWVFFDATKISQVAVCDLAQSFATDKPGFLLCNGGAYSRTAYADLFAILDTSFGVGDGSTTFNVPDFRGRTLQGANGNLKTVLAAGLPNATGTFWGLRTGNTGFSGAFSYGTNIGDSSGGGGSLASASMSLHNSNAIYGASTTVQPPAIAVNIFIKY